MNIAQRILKNTLSLLGGNIIATFLGFIAVVYLARVLGPEGFGKINFAMAIILYFTLMVNFGLSLLGTRQIARKREKIGDYIGTIISLRLCLAIFSFCLLLLMLSFLNKPLETKYLILLYAIGLIPYALFLDWAFQGVEKMEYVGLGHILKSGIYLGLVFWFVRSPQQLLFIPCFQVTASLFVSAFLLFIFVKKFGKLKFKFDLISWSNILRQALTMGFALIVTQMFFHIDTVMLGFMKGNKEVGYYNAAYKIIIFITMLRTAYAEAIYPVASSYYKTSLGSFKRLLQLSTKLMATLAVPLAIGGTILARPLIHLFYGLEYDRAVIAFQILVWAAALICINIGYVRGLLSCGREYGYARAVTIAAIINIILNFILIPKLGLVGAAIATVATQTIAFMGVYIEFGKVMKIPFMRYLLEPILASSVMSLFLYWGLKGIGLNLFWLIFGGAAIYLASFYLMKGITKDELKLIRSAVLARR